MNIFPEGVHRASLERDAWRGRATLPQQQRTAPAGWDAVQRAISEWSHVSLGGGIITTTDAWRNSPWMRPSIEMFAGALASRPLKLYKGRAEITSHWLLNLLARPNETLRLSEFELKYQTFAIYELFGECFWFLEYPTGLGTPNAGNPVAPNAQPRRGAKAIPSAIWVYHPHAVTEIYNLRNPSEFLGWQVYWENKAFFVDKLDAVHFRHYDPTRHNPLRPSRGSSPYGPKMLSISSDLAASRFNLDFFNRGVAPNVVFMNKGEIQQTTEGEFIERLKAKVAGKNGEPLVLDQGEWTVQQLNSMQKDAEFTVGKEQARAETLGGLTPPVAVGKDDASYANAEIQTKVWWTYRLKPSIRSLCSAMDAAFLWNDADFWTDLSTKDVPELQADERDRIKAASDLVKTRVPWTVAAKLFDIEMDRFAGDDIAMGSFSDVPVDDLIAGQDIRLALAATVHGNTAPTTTTTPATNDAGAAQPTATPDEAAAVGADAKPTTQKSIVVLARDRAITVVGPAAVRTVTPAQDDTLRMILAIIAADDAKLQALGQRFQLQALQAGIKQVGSLIGLSSLVAIDNPAVTQFLAERGNLITSVNATTADDINATIRELMDGGSSPEDIGRAIRDTFNLRDKQSKLIARTEVGSGLNGGRFIQMQDAGVTQQEWLCVAGDTLLTGPGVTHLARRWREGRWVTLRTHHGRVVTVTADHKILTGRGWVRAEDVEQGDYLVSYEPSIEAPSGVVPDVENVPAAIEQVFSAAHERGAASGMVSRVVNFDGEGRQSDVDVVLADGELRDRLQPTKSQSLNNQLLELTDLGLADLLGAGHLCDGGIQARSAVDVEMPRLGNAGFAGVFGASDNASLGMCAGPDAGKIERPSYDRLARLPLLGEAEDGCPVPVGFCYDECIGVDVVTRACHAFDYTTATGWMVGNGLVIHNSSRDDRVRETHQEIDGETIAIGDTFSNGCRYPQDPSGDPSEVINCRCIAIGVSSDRAARIADRAGYWRASVNNVRTIETAMTRALTRYFVDQRARVLKAASDAGIAK